ncbi:hypothetical protein [Nonomuraea sp. NPDC049141]|uniref:hypothetical protein n=1 Tax=Nonomuraea sp. NPDC049141 TaxID=3155500 RepID=UPI00340D9917
MSRADAHRKLTREQARELVPFLEAGRRGLAAANWRVGMEADDLVAPVVLAVIAEVQRHLPSGVEAALERLRDARAAWQAEYQHYQDRAQRKGYSHDEAAAEAYGRAIADVDQVLAALDGQGQEAGDGRG